MTRSSPKPRRRIRRRGVFAVGIALAAAVASTACGGSERSANDPQVQREAMDLWRDRCATCHGLDGHGDGPQARYLAVRPRTLSDQKWKRTVTDEHLRTVIVEGGPAVGLNLAMAPNPDLASRPAVLQALIAYVRKL